MRIADKGPADLNVSQLVRGEQTAAAARDKKENRQVGATDNVAQVSISTEARELQKVVALAERGDELRAEKLRQIKEQIDNGTYHVKAEDVAKSLVRHEASQLLGKA